jgi:hypothetical protein
MVSHIRLGSPVARHSKSEWFSDSVSCGVCCCASLTDMKVGATVSRLFMSAFFSFPRFSSQR